MSNLPTTQGDAIYAAKDGVQIYESADVTADKLSSSAKGRLLVFNKGDLIGVYTGTKTGSFFQIDTIVNYEYGIFGWGAKKRTLTGFVNESQITGTSKSDIDEAKKLEEEKKFQEQLDQINGGGSKTGTTASSTGGISTGSGNIVLFVFGLLLLALGGAYIWVIRKSKNKNIVKETIKDVKDNGTIKKNG